MLQYLADDTSRLRVGPARKQTFLVHRVENAAMDGLQAVADVRQCTADDHGHRIREERLSNLVFDIQRRKRVIRGRRQYAFAVVGIIGLVRQWFYFLHRRDGRLSMLGRRAILLSD